MCLYMYVELALAESSRGVVWNEDEVKEAELSLTQFNYEVDDHTLQTQHTTYRKWT